MVLFIACVILIISLSFQSIVYKACKDLNILTSIAIVYLALIGLSIPNVNPSKLSLKTLIIATCICTAVVLWGFQAGIVSVLTVDVVDLPIKSLKVKPCLDTVSLCLPQFFTFANLFLIAFE